MIEDGFAQMLGPDWRKVIDTTAPLGGYAMFKPELKDAVLVGFSTLLAPSEQPAGRG